MEFMAYGLLYAAVTNPKQLTMELRGIPHQALEHPYMKHAMQVTCRAETTHPGEIFCGAYNSQSVYINTSKTLHSVKHG